MTREAAGVVGDDLYESDDKLPREPVLTPKQALVIVRDRPPSLQGVRTCLVQSVAEAEEFMRWLGESREVLAVDTETEGFDPYHDKLRLIQIGDAMSGWAIPFEGWGGVALEALAKYEGPFVYHNASFDVKFLEAQAKYNAPWHRIHDTMIQAHVIDPTQSVALKNLSVRLVDKRANAGEQLLKTAFHDNKWTWATVPIDYEAYWAYGALDTVLTARLFETLRAHERYPQVYDLEMASRRICTRMEQTGAPVDLEYCQTKMDGLLAYTTSVKEWGLQKYGIGLGSNLKLAEVLTNHGAVIEKRTPKNFPSVDKHTLQILASDESNPEVSMLAQTVLKMRKSDKIATTYLKNFLDFAVDGVVHCSINTLGARTGRMSIRNPALQTLGKSESTVRDAFIAHEGNTLVTCDLDQVEARLLAHFSQDKGLISAFRSENDFFLTIARNLFRDPELGMKDKRRKLTKNTVYAKMYGAGPAKMAATAGVTEAQMHSVLDALDSSYPGITEFARTVENIGARRLTEEGIAYVTTPLGRRLPADEKRMYALTNYVIQATAAEVLKIGIVKADNAGLGDYLILPVHDELVMSVPKEDAEDAKKALQEAMTIDDGTFTVPLTASAEGPYERWGDSIED